MDIRRKRANARAAPADGYRVLIERRRAVPARAVDGCATMRAM